MNNFLKSGTMTRLDWAPRPFSPQEDIFEEEEDLETESQFKEKDE